jgi:hypothetical protein
VGLVSDLRTRLSVYGNQKTCDECISRFTARQRDRKIARAKGVDHVDLFYRDTTPDPFADRLMGQFPEPARLQQQNARLGMVSVVLRGETDGSMTAGSIEANAVLRALSP